MASSRVSPLAPLSRQLSARTSPFHTQFQCLRQPPRAALQSRHLSSTPRLYSFRDKVNRRAALREIIAIATNNLEKSDEFAFPKLKWRGRKKASELHSGGMDIGLIPMTFIYPKTDATKRPAWIGDWRGRLALEVYRVKSFFYTLSGIFQYWSAGARKLGFFRPRKHAAEGEKLYRSLYTAFAAGDINTLNAMCCEGLLDSLRNRIRNRPKDQPVQWEYELLGRPKVVSHRGLPFPKEMTDGANMGLRQVVVRITSLQRTVRARGAGGGGEGSAEDKMEEQPRTSATVAKGRSKTDQVGWKKVVELVTLQKQFNENKEGDWLVWGMAEESTMDDVAAFKEDEKKFKQQSPSISTMMSR